MIEYYGYIAKELSPDKLLLLRNAIYAKHGYVFKNPDLNEFFKACESYIPNPNLKMDDILLSKGDEALLVAIKALEKKNE